MKNHESPQAAGSIRPAFQLLLDRSQSPFERRAGFVYGNFSYDSAFKTRQPGLLRTFEGDQIEAAVGILLVGHANGQIQSRLEVVARIKLLYGNGIGRIRRTRVSVDYGLQ